MATAEALARGKYSLELIPDISLCARVLTAWTFAAPVFMSVFDNAGLSDTKVLPPLAPLMVKAAAEPKIDGKLPYVFRHSGSYDARTLFVCKLWILSALRRLN